VQIGPGHLTGIHKPGHTSDPLGDRYATITWNQPIEVIETAMDKMEAFVQSLGAAGSEAAAL
jgi:hypothetical protein